jgi:hypothetical protein
MHSLPVTAEKSAPVYQQDKWTLCQAIILFVSGAKTSSRKESNVQ